MEVECSCDKFEPAISTIDNIIAFGYTHGLVYLGGTFVYCPFCGKELSHKADKTKGDSK